MPNVGDFELSKSPHHWQCVAGVTSGEDFNHFLSVLWLQRLASREFPAALSRSLHVEIDPALQIEIEGAVGIDVGVDQRGETAIVFRCHARRPGRL